MAVDPGNNFTEAKAVSLAAAPLRLKDRLGKSDEDVYRFRLSKRSSFHARLTRLTGNADIELMQDLNGSGRTELGEIVASSRAPDRRRESIKLVGLSAGTYYLRVFPQSGEATGYQLSLSAKPVSKANRAYEIVQRTNAVRASRGLPALAVNTQLTQAAQAYARSLAVDDNWSHTGVDGSSPWDRMVAAGYRYSQAAENLAAGHTTPASAIDGWLKSPGHRANLLAYQVQEIGVGYFYLNPDPGRVTFQSYWSQLMGTPEGVRVTPNVPED